MNSKTQELQDKILAFFKNQEPVKGKNGYSAQVSDVKVIIPKELEDLEKQTEMKYKGTSLMGSVRGRVTIKSPTGQIVSKGNPVVLVKFPVFTDRNTIIQNGHEKYIQNQLNLKPGVFTTNANSRGEARTELNFIKPFGSSKVIPRLQITYNPVTTKNIVTITSIKGKKINIPALSFLREIGFNDQEIIKLLGNNPRTDEILKQGFGGKIGIDAIYEGLTGESVPKELTTEQTRQSLYDYFKENARFGNGVDIVKNSLGIKNENSEFLSKDVLSGAVAKTIAVGVGSAMPDEKDDLKNQQVLSGTDLILEQIEKEYINFKKSAKSELENNAEAIKEKGAITFKPILKMGDSMHSFLTNGSVVQGVPDDANVMYVESINRELTHFGNSITRGNVSQGKANKVDNMKRDLSALGFNRIDPIEVPESDKIGLTQHLSQGAVLRDRTIYSKFYVVKGGEASIKSQSELSAKDEENVKVAYYNPEYINVDPKTGAITFKKTSVKGRYLGKTQMLPASEIQYIDRSSRDVLGTTANMVPFVAHDDGARVLMACAQQKQAVPLINREVPLVSTIADEFTGETYEEKLGKDYGKPVISGVSGIVTSTEGSKIIIKSDDKKRYVYQRYNYYPFNGAYITNELKVKVGDHVTKGQMLAEGWQTRDGKLSLGLNANVMYLPYKGHNFEDGVVISQSFAKRMSSEEVSEKEFYIPKDCKGGRGSGCLREVLMYKADPTLSSALDKDGIIKVGTIVKVGTPLIAYLAPVSSNSSLEDLIKSADKNNKFVERIKQVESGSYFGGEVVRVNIIDKPDATSSQKIVITVKEAVELKPGDKVAGRHGNKGTITKILPDNQMPVTIDGTVAEVLMSPLGVPSRKNVGQLFEANAGLIAKKTGQERKILNFDETEKDKILEDLKKIGLPDARTKVFLRELGEDGKIHKVPTENPVAVGNMYMLKLKHKVDDKVQSRSNTETTVNQTNYMPSKQVGKTKGEKHNPQALGEMEMRALVGHGAAWNILEATTLKSDGGGDIAKRAALFKALSSQKIDPKDLDFAATPETLNVLSDKLKTLGLSVSPLKRGKAVKSFDDAYDSLKINPLNTNDFVKLVGKDKAVTRDVLYDARNLTSQSGKVTPVKGGLLDESIFGSKTDGEDNRNKWGYIKLSSPVANPLFAKRDDKGNIYADITGKSGADISNLSTGKKVLVIDPNKYAGFKGLAPEIKADYISKSLAAMAELKIKPGDLVDTEVVDKASRDGKLIPYSAGGDALYKILESVDLKKELEKATSDLNNTKNPTGFDRGKLSGAYERVKSIRSMINEGTKPTDLMLTAIPVAPAHIRPVMFGNDGQLISSDLNDLYGNIIKVNNNIKQSVGGLDMTLAMPPRELANRESNLYKSVAQFMGIEERKTSRGAQQGVLDTIGGKTGLIRGQMLKKRIDFSGRSVIGVDPELKIDEVALPFDMAKNMYKPFIIKELVRTGRAKNTAEAEKKLSKSDDDTRQALKNIVKDRPVVLGRQPSLHKFSIMSFRPVIKDIEDGTKVKNIQISPLVTPGFGADFDGDQMYSFVPISDKAKEEAETLMRPSQNLINPTDGKMVVEINNEMLTGIYYISSKTPTGKPKKYSSYDSLFKDYMGGVVSSSQAVSVPIAQGTVTVGQALINWCIPDKVAVNNRQFSKAWGKSEVSSMIANLYKQGEDSGWKLISMTEIGAVLDKLKKLGFDASTRSGVSISVSDFTQINNISDMYNQRLMESKDKYGNMDEAQIKAWQGVETQIQKDITSGKILPEDNNLNIMMHGGRAKGNAISKMIATVGVFQNIQGQLKDPVKSSFFKGLSGDEYYNQGNEARKGIYDRSVSTSDPGALAREVWHMAQDVTISEKDCGTREYITCSKNDSNIRGRYAATDIISSEGKVICKRNQMITDKIIEILAKDDSVTNVRVRSPLRCKTPHGCCAMCYGSNAGTLTPVKRGAAVGTLATHALAEPTTQMTMKTFHAGGADSSAALGIQRVSDILSLSDIKKNAAVLSKCSGIIFDIEELKNGTFVYVGSARQKQKIDLNPDGTNRILKVKKGDIVTKGDMLTVGDAKDLKTAVLSKKSLGTLTFADPKDMYKFKSEEVGTNQAVNEVKDYLVESMRYTLNTVKPVDQKHIEVLVNKLGSNAQVLDAGDSDFTRGQYVDKNEIDRWNKYAKQGAVKRIVPLKKSDDIIGRISAKTYKQGKNVIVKKGDQITNTAYSTLSKAKNLSTLEVLPKPVTYDAIMQTKKTVSYSGHDNWLSNIGFQDVNRGLSMGAALGQVDTLKDPKSRIMTGKLPNIGTGFGVDPNTSNGFSGKMFNFFANLNKKKK